MDIWEEKKWPWKPCNVASSFILSDTCGWVNNRRKKPILPFICRCIRDPRVIRDKPFALRVLNTSA